MARPKKGEMTKAEIQNLVRQHNKLTTIVLAKKSREDLINEITKMGYRIDHAKKRIVRVPGKTDKTVVVSKVSEKGKTKQAVKKETKAKAKAKLKGSMTGLPAPVLVGDRGEVEV
tara:strand:- start:450 stop:794 length:345 start_codon:yes stop_codon:yes gene_type:complete